MVLVTKVVLWMRHRGSIMDALQIHYSLYLMPVMDAKIYIQLRWRAAEEDDSIRFSHAYMTKNWCRQVQTVCV
jgi:hypothetical protein